MKMENEEISVDDKVAQLHNNFVVSILQLNELAADFLSHYIPLPTSERVDWSRLTSEPTALAAEPNKLYAADFLFSAPFKDARANATFFVLLEHKSDVEKTLPLQLLKYIALKANDFATNRVGEIEGRWPCPIALVLYNGEKPWKRPPTLRDALYVDADLSQFIPDFQYIMVDLASIDAENFRGGPLVRLFLELLKRAKNGTLRPALKGMFRRLGAIPWNATVRAAARSFYFYIAGAARNAGDVVTLAEIKEAVHAVENKEAREEMKNFADELRNEGRVEGRVEGFALGAASEAARYVRRRFGDAISSELLARIETINDYPTLEKIRDSLFDSKGVDEFKATLGELLK